MESVSRSVWCGDEPHLTGGCFVVDAEAEGKDTREEDAEGERDSGRHGSFFSHGSSLLENVWMRLTPGGGGSLAPETSIQMRSTTFMEAGNI